MRKKLLAMFLLLILLLPGCAEQKDITPQEIVEAYQEAGYSVWYKMYDEPVEFGEIGYIQANHPDGDYIYFQIFETTQLAKKYKREGYHPMVMTLFLSIYAGELYVPKWEVYGNMVIQYENPAFYQVFQDLLKSK